MVWRHVAVGPDGYPLSLDSRRVGLEVEELLLLLGIRPPLTTSLFLRLVEAEVLLVTPELLARLDGMPSLLT